VKKILSGGKTGIRALILCLLFFNVGLAAGDKEQERTNQETMKLTDGLEVKLIYGPDTNGPEHFWPGGSLKDLFLKYWKARLSKNWEEAREMEAPYFQEMTTAGRYRMYISGGKKQEWAELKLVQFNWEEEQLCRIKMVLYFRLENGRVKKVHLSDRWVKAEGNWYHVIRDGFFFPGV